VISDQGEFIRQVLEPMADELGVGYDESFFKPPQTDAEMAMSALRCGEGLLHAFTRPDEWPGANYGFGLGLSKRETRRRRST
jgi:hypothetical protein